MPRGIGFWGEYRWLQPRTQRTKEAFGLGKGCRWSVAPPEETALAQKCHAHVHLFLHQDSPRQRETPCAILWAGLVLLLEPSPMKSRDQDEITHLRAELDALSRISRKISMRLEVQAVLETILQEVGGFFGT